MIATIDSKADGYTAILITADWSEVAPDYEDVFAEFAKAAVPGFRPGKAPRAAVEQRFRRQLRDSVTARCGRRLARQALGEKNLRIAGSIRVTEIRFEPRGQLSFAAECVPVPRLELPDYARAALSGATEDERRDALSEWLLAHTAWDVPEPLVRQECGRSGRGEPESDEWRAAAQRVKLLQVLEQIAEAEGIDADERDVDERIARMAAGSGRPPSELRRQLGEDGLGRLQSLLRAEQTLAYMLERNASGEAP